MRRVIRFTAGGVELVGTLDPAPGPVGVLIVSGGSEPRAGAHRGMAMLAQALAARGIPVFRFDRRGVGDSAGDDAGFAASQPDLLAAALIFRHQMPGMRSLIGFGNCDAAAALALFGRHSGVHAVVLANPWLGAEPDALPPAAAIAAHYRARLRHPGQWLRLLRGAVDWSRLGHGLRKLARPRAASDPLRDRVLAGIAEWGDAAQLVLADGDGTALGFAAAARGRGFPTITLDTASHSFADRLAALQALIADAVAAHARRYPD